MLQRFVDRLDPYVGLVLITQITAVKSARLSGGDPIFLIGACTLAEEEYNREGELVVFAPEIPLVQVLNGHFSPSTGLRQTVTDIVACSENHPGTFFSCGYDGCIKLWKFRENNDNEEGSMQLVSVWRGHRDKVHSMARHGSDLVLASASQDGSVLMWPYDLDQKASTKPSPLFRSNSRQGIPDFVQWGEGKSSENLLFTLSSYSPAIKKGQLMIWDGILMQKLGSVSPPAGGLSAIAVSPDGSLFACGGGTTLMGSDEVRGDGFLRFYDMRLLSSFSKSVFRIHTDHTDTDSIIFSPDSFFAISCQGYSNGAELKVYDFRNNHVPVHVLYHQPQKESIIRDSQSSVVASAWRSDGILVTGGADSRIRAWNLSSIDPEIPEYCQATNAPVSTLSFGPFNDDSLLISGTESGSVFLWSASRAMDYKLKQSFSASDEYGLFYI